MKVLDNTIIKLYENDKQVSEILLEDIKTQGWDIVDFLDFQMMTGRTWQVSD